MVEKKNALAGTMPFLQQGTQNLLQTRLSLKQQ